MDLKFSSSTREFFALSVEFSDHLQKISSLEFSSLSSWTNQRE